jgi:hypothetical protein
METQEQQSTRNRPGKTERDDTSDRKDDPSTGSGLETRQGAAQWKT